MREMNSRTKAQNAQNAQKITAESDPSMSLLRFFAANPLPRIYAFS
jgi:hypothetical protein